MIEPFYVGIYPFFDTRKGYYTFENNTFKYYSFDGEKKYELKLEGRITNSKFLIDEFFFYNQIVFLNGDLHTTLEIVNIKNGKSVEIIKYKSTSSLITNGLLVADDLTGNIELLDIVSFEIIWSIERRTNRFVIEDITDYAIYCISKEKCWSFKKISSESGKEIWISSTMKELEESNTSFEGLHSEDPKFTDWIVCDNILLVQFQSRNILFANAKTGEALKYFKFETGRGKFHFRAKENVVIRLTKTTITSINIRNFELSEKELNTQSMESVGFRKDLPCECVCYTDSYIFFLNSYTKIPYIVEINTLDVYLFFDYFELNTKYIVRFLSIDDTKELLYISYMDGTNAVYDIKNIEFAFNIKDNSDLRY